MSVVISPHNDDETLFAAFTILRDHAHVIVCMQSAVEEKRGEGVTAAQRNAETVKAVGILGGTVEFLPFTDYAPDYDAIVKELARRVPNTELVYAPAVELGGNAQHNIIGSFVQRLFGIRIITSYMTYTTSGKSVSSHRVPFNCDWALLKMKALACYESQITRPLYVDHFLREQYEYYAET